MGDLRMVRRCEWNDCEHGEATHAIEVYMDPERVRSAFAQMSTEEAGQVLWKELVEQQLQSGPHLYQTRYLCLLHAALALNSGYDNLAFAGDVLHPNRKDTIVFFRRTFDQYHGRFVFKPMQSISAVLEQIDTEASGDFIFT